MRWGIIVGIVFAWSSSVFAQDADLAGLMRNAIDQLRARVDEELNAFASSKDAGERFLHASILHEVTQDGTFREYPSVLANLKASQKDRIAVALKSYQSTLRAVATFEATLTADDVALFADDPSTFRAIGRFSSRSDLGTCDRAKFDALRAAWPGKDFFGESLRLRAWENARRERLLPGEIKRLLEKFSARIDASGSAAELRGYYKVISSAAEEFVGMLSQGSLEKVEKELEPLAKGADLHAWVSQWVARHPECLASSDGGYGRLRDESITREEGGRWLAEAVRAKKKPKNCRIVQNQANQSDLRDAWDRTFLFEWKDGACRMYSSGPDVRDDGDDIEVGILPL